MKLFVSYSFRAEDAWIENLVIPLIQAMDIDVITGKNIAGEVIPQTVQQLISSSDALIAIFTTPWASYPWVGQELVTALSLNIPAIEIKEQTLDPIGGITQNRQHINFDLNKKEALLVDLAKILARWKKIYETRSLVILPPEIMESARLLLEYGTLTCMYQFMNRYEESPQYTAKPFQLHEALAVNIKNIPSPEAYVKIVIQGPGFHYSCGYQAFSLIPINLKKL